MNLLISAVTWDQALRSGMSQADLAAEAAALGCQGVEIRQYWRTLAVDLPAAAAALASQKLAAAYACNEGLLADSPESTRAMLAAVGEDLTAAANLGAKLLRLNLAAGPFARAFIDAAWWRREIAGLLRRAAVLGIPLAVENGPDPLKSDILLLAHLLGSIDSPWLRLTFDTGNWLYAGVSPEAALDALGHHVGYVHLKDIVESGGTLKYSHPGTGRVDVRGLARRLVAGGYDGFMALEFPGGDDPRGRVKSSLAYLAG